MSIRPPPSSVTIRRPSGSRLGLAIGLVLLTACGSPPQPPIQQAPPERGAHMFTHFSRIGEIQSALIHADLSDAQRAARWMAEHESSEGLAPEWDDYVNQMRLDARSVQTAPSMEEASLGAARLAQTCGSCHVATGGSLPYVGGSAPVAGGTRVDHMLRHLWAADRMWEGLLAPSNEAWSAGARALADHPLDSDELPAGYGGAAAIANRLHELGERAQTTAAGMARAELYGELITTCAQCHAMVGVGS